MELNMIPESKVERIKMLIKTGNVDIAQKLYELYLKRTDFSCIYSIEQTVDVGNYEVARWLASHY
jgi:hypothetical protein